MSAMEIAVKPTEAERGSGKLGLVALVALVVGSMIGGGVFSLPQNMAKGASPGAVVIGWLITGIGMLALAFVYQGLSTRKPALDAGPYAYARAGFGDFVGFNSAWGYWLSAWLGNVSYVVLIFGALSYFYPAFGAEGNTTQAIIGASVVLWITHALILMGIRQAAIINVVTTIAKLVPILLFILLVAVAFNPPKFSLDFWGTQTPASAASWHRSKARCWSRSGSSSGSRAQASSLAEPPDARTSAVRRSSGSSSRLAFIFAYRCCPSAS